VPGPQEWFIIVVVILLVFGPERLPELVRTTAKGLQRFRALTQRSVDEFKRVAEVEELDRELRQLRRELSQTRDQVNRSVSGGTRAAGNDPRPLADDQAPPIDPDAT
jgi:sec-independent protein translocase protein TatB